MKLIYHLNFNDIWLSLCLMNKYFMKFQFSPNFFLTVSMPTSDSLSISASPYQLLLIQYLWGWVFSKLLWRSQPCPELRRKGMGLSPLPPPPIAAGAYSGGGEAQLSAGYGTRRVGWDSVAPRSPCVLRPNMDVWDPTKEKVSTEIMVNLWKWFNFHSEASELVTTGHQIVLPVIKHAGFFKAPSFRETEARKMMCSDSQPLQCLWMFIIKILGEEHPKLSNFWSKQYAGGLLYYMIILINL